MKNKYYFRHQGSEVCYTLDYHLANAKEEGLSDVELCEAIPYRVNDIFWCKKHDVSGEDGFCGKGCDDYSPKNGKSGMCRFKSSTMYTHGEKKKFKVK